MRTKGAILVVLLLLALGPVAPLPAPGVAHGEGAQSTAPTRAVARPGGPAFVPARPLPLAPSSNASYDEQLGMTFTQNFTSMLYNVTAIEQTDPSSQAGPAYLLNGLSTSGYWYQVGLAWNWNPGHTPGTGFDMVYEVFSPAGSSVFPLNGGGGLQEFSGVVSQGDVVVLNLYFSSTGRVVMLAQDKNSGAYASETYSGEGATYFVGSSSSTANPNGFFTGLMTEWYHPSPYYGNEAGVTYSSSFALASAWMWVDEFECPDASCSTQTVIFSDYTPSPVSYSNPTQLQVLSSHGATEYSNAYTFITGSKTLTSLTLSYSVLGGGGPYSPPVLHYYQNGVIQSAILNSYATSYLVDNGSQWSVNGDLTGSNQNERWQTNMTTSGPGSAEAITLAYYHQDLVSFGVTIKGGGGGSPPPAITYIEFGTSATTATGVQVWADAGSASSFLQVLEGSAGGERWAAAAPTEAIAAPGLISIVYYHQFLASLDYAVAGGGAPASPVLNAEQFGAPTSEPLTAAMSGYWIDSGSSWKVPSVLNGTTGERWTTAGTLSGTAGAAFSESYTFTHQYYVTVGGTPSQGIAQLTASGWRNAGSNVTVAVEPAAGWQFQGWTGAGPGGFDSNSSSTTLVLRGPANERSQLYPGLTISVSGSGSVRYLFGGHLGTVSAGSETVYAPVGTTVTVVEAPSSFLYSFGGWGGLATGSASQEPVGLTAPGSVTAAFGYNMPVIAALAALAAALVAAVSLALRGRAARAKGSGPARI